MVGVLRHLRHLPPPSPSRASIRTDATPAVRPGHPSPSAVRPVRSQRRMDWTLGFTCQQYPPVNHDSSPLARDPCLTSFPDTVILDIVRVRPDRYHRRLSEIFLNMIPSLIWGPPGEKYFHGKGLPNNSSKRLEKLWWAFG